MASPWRSKSYLQRWMLPMKQPSAEITSEKLAMGAAGEPGPSASPGAEGAPRAKRWKVLVITSLGVFMVSLDTTIVNIAFPAIESTFPGTTRVVLSWVLNIYFIVF